MYYYVEEPGIQSPEQRSIIFAALAAYASLLTALWCSLLPWFLKGPGEYVFDVLFPIFTTFVVLYRGSLYADFGRLARIALLSAVSIVIFTGMIFFMGSFLVVMAGHYYLSMRQP